MALPALAAGGLDAARSMALRPQVPPRALLTGLMASLLILILLLPGCAAATRTAALPPPPVAITIRDTPPADLVTCPTPPAPIPPTTAAIPAPVRKGLIALALAYRATVDQLTRLIAWSDPEHACTPKATGAPTNLLPPN